MKKNVFSRAIAVLASMAVLGAASMMSASAAGVSGATVTAEPGSKVGVDFTVNDVPGCAGAELVFTAAAPLTITSPGAAMANTAIDGGFECVFVDGGGNWTGTTVTVEVAADAKPGSYPVNISIKPDADGIDDGQGGYVPDPVLVQGTVIVPEAATEPETDPTTAPATTPAPEVTTTVAKTTVKGTTTSAPKTGTAGVAVAVAGLVTAGATAVVLKKKH